MGEHKVKILFITELDWGHLVYSQQGTLGLGLPRRGGAIDAVEIIYNSFFVQIVLGERF